MPDDFEHDASSASPPESPPPAEGEWDAREEPTAGAATSAEGMSDPPSVALSQEQDSPASPPAEESTQAPDEPASEEVVAAPDAATDDTVTEEEEPPPPENKKHWYVVKVQSGREDTIKEAIERRMRKDGLEEFFGQIVIPVEKVSEIKVDPKTGKRVTKTREKKLYPGYLMVEVEYNDRILYLFRETSGVGDFVGAHPGDLQRAPTPMSEKEVQKILGPAKAPGDEKPVPAPPKDMRVGDRVRVTDGTFNGMEGNVKQILDAVGKIQVELTIFGRGVAVDLEYYQVEPA